MIITFLLGVIAGFITPMVEPQVRQALEKLALQKIDVEERELDMVTLVLLLLAAALVTGAGNSLALLVGAFLGIFGKRILAAIKGDAS